jgi:AcrR family transcriptional regulator
MPTPTRILRAIAEELDPTILQRNPREEIQFARIMKVAPDLLTFYNTDRITFTALAAAMKMAPPTLRHHFVDIPALLGHLIREHLRDISAAVAQVPWDAPDRPRLRRAAYLAFTRKPLGAYTEIHLLMLNNLPSLPEDVRTPLIAVQDQISAGLAPPDQAEFVLSMLENPFMTPRRIEAIIATPEYAWQESCDPPAPRPTLALAPPEPGEPIDLLTISGDKIPGANVWIKRTYGALDDTPDEDLQNQTIRPGAPCEARSSVTRLDAARATRPRPPPH